jgi:hypothetical protein
MPEGRVSPPDEEGWQEISGQRKIEFLDLGKRKIHFYELRTYANPKTPYFLEIIVTMNFFNAGVVLKRYAVKIDKDDEQVDLYFLLLSDNCWARGVLDENYLAKMDFEEREGEAYLRLTLQIKTAEGMKSRIVRTKIRSA